MYLAPNHLTALLAMVVYIVGNIAISHLEQRSASVYSEHWIRAVFNPISLCLIAWVVGPAPVAWLVAIPTVVGSTFSKERWQARLIQIVSIVPQTIVSMGVGVSPMMAGTALLVLATLAFVLEGVYGALLEASFRRMLREHDLAVVNLQLEAALEQRKRFLATMSHEIRTPMNGVLGMAELLGTTELSGKQQNMVGIIHRSGQGLLQVINGILDLSKLEAGRVEVEEKPYPPEVVVSEVLDLLRHSGLTPGVELRYEGHDVPDHVVGDSSRLRQVLINLVGNAVKFTKEGSITVRCGWADDRLELEVLDTGPGMRPELHRRVFEPFFQADNSTSQAHGGTGLGLAISRHLVGLMNGAITVESTVGVGSSFRFDIAAPRAEAEVLHARSSAESLDASEHGLDARVMLVDDNPVNLTVASTMLRQLGCEVTDFDNAPEALEQFRSDDFDIVFMDCRMPGMDGFQATQALRKRGVHLPIIALTAGVTPEEQQRCADAGIDFVLAKPATMRGLRDAIAQHHPASIQAAHPTT